MLQGRSITIRTDEDYRARLKYLGKGKSDIPILIYVHPQNVGQTHLAWVLYLTAQNVVETSVVEQQSTYKTCGLTAG